MPRNGHTFLLKSSQQIVLKPYPSAIFLLTHIINSLLTLCTVSSAAFARPKDKGFDQNGRSSGTKLSSRSPWQTVLLWASLVGLHSWVTSLPLQLLTIGVLPSGSPQSAEVANVCFKPAPFWATALFSGRENLQLVMMLVVWLLCSLPALLIVAALILVIRSTVWRFRCKTGKTSVMYS